MSRFVFYRSFADRDAGQTSVFKDFDKLKLIIDHFSRSNYSMHDIRLNYFGKSFKSGNDIYSLTDKNGGIIGFLELIS